MCSRTYAHVKYEVGCTLNLVLSYSELPQASLTKAVEKSTIFSMSVEVLIELELLLGPLSGILVGQECLGRGIWRL